MSNNPRRPPFTQVSQMFTQGVQTVVNFSATALRPNAKVPEVRVKDPQNPDHREVHKLVQDFHLLGRSSRCDITVRNTIVSQTHLSLTQNPKNPRSFILRDEDSKNGVYIRKEKLKKDKTFPLYHGDVFYLGSPQLKEVAQVKYYNPPPWWVSLLNCGFWATGSIFALIVVALLYQWSKIEVSPMPEGVTGPVVVLSGDRQTPLRDLANDAHRELAGLSDFSPHVVNAAIASEDSRYYWHLGVDPIGIVRAIQIRFTEGNLQGASTITQQLARSLYSHVGRDNTAGRKIREMITALKLEYVYSKDHILKTYLNRVYLGVGKYGFEDAAQFYFDKSAADLNISEAASLVAVLPAPNSFNPVQDYETSVGLRNRILERMLKLGMISEEEERIARRSRINVSPKARKAFSNTRAPYFYSYVINQIYDNSLLGSELAKEGNFIIETTLDLEAQEKAEQALREKIKRDGSRLGFQQGAMVTLDSNTGEILALVGGADYQESQFNRAVQAQRQPGSTFKVFAYAAALDKGISPGKLYPCDPLTWQGQKYKPCERSIGEIDMYRGLAMSENSVALRVAQDAGLKEVVKMAQKLGVKSPLNPVPGLVLGQSEVNVLEMTGAYAAFANNGVWHRPHGIRIIRDSSDCTNPKDYQTCRIIYSLEDEGEAGEEVIKPDLARTMTRLLQGVVQGGTGRSAAMGLGEGGKTGTTNRNVDLWFIGYVPQRNVVTGIWLGNDDNSPTRGASSQAAALWGQYMKAVLID